MKTKILSKLFLFASLGIIFLTTSSEDTGYYAAGNSCGGAGCHGTAVNTATTVSLTGLPATFVTGTTYPLTFTISHATNPEAGFNIFVSGGIFVAGTGSKVNGIKNQITHTAPKAAVSGITTFTFSWTAPSSISPVTFSCVGNAVNGDGNENVLDHWNNSTVTISGSFPAAINDINETIITCYPNPTNNYLIAEGINNQAKNIILHNLYGQHFSAVYSFESNNCKINCSNLPIGIYFLSANINGKIARTTFVKN